MFCNPNQYFCWDLITKRYSNCISLSHFWSLSPQLKPCPKRPQQTRLLLLRRRRPFWATIRTFVGSRDRLCRPQSVSWHFRHPPVFPPLCGHRSVLRSNKASVIRCPSDLRWGALSDRLPVLVLTTTAVSPVKDISVSPMITTATDGPITRQTSAGITTRGNSKVKQTRPQMEWQ